MELIALELMAHSHEPTGARRLAEIYRRKKIDLAEATAGRFLRSLDERGLTRTDGVRGRVLTEAGGRHLDQLRSQQLIDARSALVAAAVDVQTLDELVDLLHVRRAVEAEAARLAATRATREEIGLLERVAGTHTTCFESCDRIKQSHNFHLLLAQASHNRMLSAVVELLLDPRNDELALLLDRIAVEAGTISGMVSAHSEIVAAIRQRDPDRTEQLARRHIETMISTANRHRAHSGKIPQSRRPVTN
jgi:DNA-binding FadR family transcriptional regulator